MTARYASTTTVSVEKTRAEIERTVTRFGADQFASGWETGRAMITFRTHGRLIRFVLPLPDRNTRAITHTPTGIRRSAPQVEKEWEQACRQSWRALLLVIKAKLEAVTAGISTVEQEFLAWVVLPDNSLVGEWLAPQIEEAYESGRMPSALPSSSLPALGAGE